MENVEIQGQSLERVKICPMTEEDVKRMGTEAWDLKGMFKTISAADVQRLVASGGDEAMVDIVFGNSDVPVPDNDNSEPSPEELASSKINVAEQVVAETPVVVKAEIVVPKVEVVDEVAQLKAKLAALEAASKPMVEVAKIPEGTLKTPGGISNADFMAKFGPKKQ
jgi:hypothetical protein